MSHAMLRDVLDTGGVWSIARGLARNVTDYKAQLATCDLPRRNDLDGRGNLSEEALADFTRLFLRVCIDQVTFMEELVAPESAAGADSDLGGGGGADRHPAAEIGGRARGGAVPGRAAARRRRSGSWGTGERQARRVTSALVDRDILVSESSRAPLRLTFPARLASRWMPGLFPDATG